MFVDPEWHRQDRAIVDGGGRAGGSGEWRGVSGGAVFADGAGVLCRAGL